MRAGLLSINSVLYAANSPERLSSDEVDKPEWLTWLTWSGEFGEFAKTHYPGLFKTVLVTGVSVIAQRGKFHTQYYLPGQDEGIRVSTRISLAGLRSPLPTIRTNPLWWWESPNYLKILEAVREAVQERFNGYEALMIRSEAAKASFAAAQAANMCVSFVSDWMKGGSLMRECVRFVSRFSVHEECHENHLASQVQQISRVHFRGVRFRSRLNTGHDN